ncbi:MAG: sigma-70 family RNA polymerase sigma factor [Deltaproteobacteria bacterium]|nr:sigma-70 family RNA polymerase sigma factor [Deltaproteobacteria bacterium]
MAPPAASPVADQSPDIDQLYRSQRARIVRLCTMLLGDAGEAEEVSQEVFLKLHRAAPDADPTTRWPAWLTTVAVNACRDRRRSRWFRWWRGSRELIEAEHAADGASPERAAIDAATRRQIWQALARLPARQREVFVLRHIESWSTAEVAAALQLTPGTVKRHLFRAVHSLRGALKAPR